MFTLYAAHVMVCYLKFSLPFLASIIIRRIVLFFVFD